MISCNGERGKQRFQSTDLLRGENHLLLSVAMTMLLSLLAQLITIIELLIEFCFGFQSVRELIAMTHQVVGNVHPVFIIHILWSVNPLQMTC